MPNQFSKQKFNFSVIIPAYQEEKIIRHCLKLYSKELREKYGFEVILSDGGSKDRTVEFASDLADKVAVHKENRRQTIAEGRNKGAELAESDVLFFINCDTVPKDIDLIFESAVKFVNRDDKFARFDAVSCPVYGFPEDLKWRDKLFYSFFNAYVGFLTSINFGMGRGECQVVRRESFWKVGGYNNDYTAGEDFDLYRRLVKSGAKITFADEFTVLESPRRFRKYGYLRTLALWSLNAISVSVFNKSFSKDWEAVR